MTKIVFMGTPAFSATVLEGLLTDEHYDIVAVVTQPDRAVGRKKEIRMTPVKEVALAHDLPIYQPEKLSGSEEMAQLMALGADGIVTAAYGQFLPSKLLDSMDFAVNVHASLLPKYRGGAPIHYAIINGDSEAGVTIMEMVKEMDAGDMVSQKALPILEQDNVGTMFEKLAVLGRDLLLETLPAYIAGEIKPVPQDASQVTFSPNISPEEERLDWNKSARDIFNQIRGTYPWPVAHTLLDGKRFKIYEADLVEGQGQAGHIIEKTKKMDKILKQAAKMLATNTNYATLVSAPDVNHNKVKFIQLSQVDDQHLLAVIVMNNNMVRNKMVNLYEALDNETILKLNILLNTSLNGLAMNEINLGTIARLKEQAGIHSGIVSDVLDALVQTFAESEDLKIYTSGATNILKYPELSDSDSAATLLSAFEEKEELASLVTESLSDSEKTDNGTGIQVYIGNESPIQTMKDCSVVTATYDLGEGVKGTIGIVGPKRMDYEKVMDNLKTLKSQLDGIYNKSDEET